MKIQAVKKRAGITVTAENLDGLIRKLRKEIRRDQKVHGTQKFVKFYPLLENLKK